MPIKQRINPFYFFALLLILGLIGCKGTESKKNSDEHPQPDDSTIAGGIRIVSRGSYSNSTAIGIMIVTSNARKRLQVDKFTVLKAQAIDEAGHRFPVSLTRHPGEVSKWGPYVSLRFDAAGGLGKIIVTAEVEYQDKKYKIMVSYKQGKPGDYFLWNEDRINLQSISSNHKDKSKGTTK